jgi:hypothetical protein
MFKPWKDVVVRLSYIHFIDNIVHTAWLRYGAIGAPYTQYISNSEILTPIHGVMLAIHAGAWIYTHVVLPIAAGPYVYTGGDSNEKQGLLEKGKNDGDTGDIKKGQTLAPMRIHSTTIDLLSPNTGVPESRHTIRKDGIGGFDVDGESRCRG